MIDALYLPRAAVDAWRGEMVRLIGMTIHVPGTRRERLSTVAGNLRVHRVLDRWVSPGATVIDVGANIGYNTLRSARRAGPRGRVVAVEPTPDTLVVLRHNVAASGLGNVVIEPVAAGSAAGTRDFFVRGERSAVNSLFPSSCYGRVTGVLRVPVMPLDMIVDEAADVVKIDVEGAELDVLERDAANTSHTGHRAHCRMASPAAADGWLQRRRVAALVARTRLAPASRFASDSLSPGRRRPAGVGGAATARARTRRAACTAMPWHVEGRTWASRIGSRPVARVLLLGPERQLLLLLAQDTVRDHFWWVTPGGGLEEGESFEQAACRELYEETGLECRIGPWIWTRRHAYWFENRWFDQYERFFVAMSPDLEVRPIQQDTYVRRHRWWTLSELVAASDEFAPRRLPELFGALARGEYPDEPIDCGV